MSSDTILNLHSDLGTKHKSHQRLIRNNSFQVILICHSNSGTKHKSHQILITISHENGVIGLQNE